MKITIEQVLRLIPTIMLKIGIPVGLFIGIYSLPAGSQSPQEIKARDEQMREVMKVWSRQLGTTCQACHDPGNFKTEKLPAYKAGKSHMRIVQALIDSGMDGKNGPKADCFMCHRGRLMPDYIEKPHPMTK